MSDATLVILSIMSVFAEIVNSLDTVAIFGDYTLLDISITLLVLDITLEFCLEVIGAAYEAEGGKPMRPPRGGDI